MALGQEDFGLYGVVGGLSIFIAFFNILLSGAIGRYYAVAIGEMQKVDAPDAANMGLENCRAWFNTALLIHTIIPLFLILVGYPIGEWFVRCFLTIPIEKIDACVWVFRLVCVSTFVSMVSVPFIAMYTAKQYIAELTIYSLVQTAINSIFFYFMATHPGVWLLKYAGWMCFMSVCPQIVICVRALKVFPECSIRFSYWFDMNRIKGVFFYAGWQMFGGVGYICRTQGLAVLVNKYFGASANAAMSVAFQASAQTQTLSAAMSAAFQPAIATAYGAGDFVTMRKMAYRASKFGVVLMLPFLIPLALELPHVLQLWLDTPPPFTVGLCWAIMAMHFIDNASYGHCLACNASGRIAAYQAVGGLFLIFSIPAAWLFLVCGGSVYMVGVAMCLSVAANTATRVFFARMLVGMSARYWLLRILLPITLLISFCGAVGFLPRFWLSPSLLRICLTTLVVEISLIPLVWYFVLDRDEQIFLISKFKLFNTIQK